jgi:hypothetical protein
MCIFNKNITIFFIIPFIILWGCESKTVQENDLAELKNFSNIGLKTNEVDEQLYQQLLYVSALKGVDEEDAGEKVNPFKSISFALSRISDASGNRQYALLVSEGYYVEKTVRLVPFVDLFGGFSAETWDRDIEKYVTELNAEGKHRVLIGADKVLLDGFLIRDGLIRGKGAAILCDGTSPVISNNIFHRNKTLGPDSWKPKYWHETANDGGAIYCVNGAAPVIKQNIFTENKTEIGRGAAIASQTQCRPEITGNVFANNVTGLNDPMRSSDGGAVSIFDWCHAKIDNNLFIANRAFGSNDAGALFVALWSSADIQKNIFLDNHTSDDAGALFVGGQEHRYDSPLDPLPSEEEFFVNIEKNIFMGNQNPSRNSGAMRFTMESRGKFTENLVVHNDGIYFQRSEVLVENNIILDNFLFIETKVGLKPGIIKDNVIWANFMLETPATVINNNIKSNKAEQQNYSRIPEFKDDGYELSVLSANFNSLTHTTEILLEKSHIPVGNLINRIVMADQKWGLVKFKEQDVLHIWGDITGELKLNLVPTYTAKKDRD